MLAKIFKDQSTIAIAPFVVPDMGGGKAPSVGVTEFQFPTVPVEFNQTETIQNVGEAVAPPPDVAEILSNAQAEAAAIVAAAEAQSQIIEAAARDKGLAAARATIDQEVALKVAEMRQQLAETIENVSTLYAQVAVRAENEIVQLSLEIARKIVSHEVKIDREIALALARVSLGRLHNRVAAFVHLHPEDFAYVSSTLR